MGGHGDFHPVKLDPSLERWALMRENVYQHFKWTPRTTRHVMIWGVIIPFATYFTLSHFDRRYDYAGKFKNQSLLRIPPKSAAPESDEQ
ncbi:hypothetical protein DB88DRAFT_501189 [Papiliotrema laurentii]|uniref:NADH dehydrogenase [ubiquinone] 1 beta subcomplex subunit 4 n=1 Tax=Papiliotrema laurentii TaxID=5418 RepID=A0AAD9CUI6_PAPLA|nr:hypothetical protein DB88DRAFT_501189 [Papiliotrema laurentii]